MDKYFTFPSPNPIHMSSTVFTHHAPEPIGPYSQAVKSANMLFCSGQIASDPETGELKMASIEEETRQVLENLKAVLHAGGMAMEEVVKCSIFLSDMKHFPIVNKVYATYFGEAQPARETVAVAGLPLGVNVEISAVAIKD